MARHAPSCTGVGAPKVFTNQSRLGAEKRFIGMPEVCHLAPTDHGTYPEAGWVGLGCGSWFRLGLLVPRGPAQPALEEKGARADSTGFVGVEVG